MNKSPSEADRRIGVRLRERRIALGMSQDRLGQVLGVTFQQVQKYEKGSNRMGAGRLQQAALALGVPVSFLFGDGADGASGDAAASGITAEEAALLSAYRRVEDPKLRKRIQQLVKAMTQD